jgi:hypothetical protein
MKLGEFISGVGEFLHEQFDKLIVFGGMALCAALVLHLVHHDAASKAVDWAEQTFTVLLGLFAGLIQAGMRRNGNGGSQPPIRPASDAAK